MTVNWQNYFHSILYKYELHLHTINANIGMFDAKKEITD